MLCGEGARRAPGLLSAPVAPAAPARPAGSTFRRRESREMAATDTTLGFVGLGHMGGAMAARLLAAGYTVHGESRTRDSAEHLIGEGLKWGDTAKAVAAASDVVFTSLPDDRVLEEVASAPDGLLAGLRAGKTWVEMSTVSPRVSRALAQRTSEQRASMLDAPVSGSVPQAQSGTLTIMVGGDEHAYERVEPILRELGTPTRIGANGQGLVLKLAINISLAVQMLAFAEGLLLAARSGVDREKALQVMAASAIGSPMLRARAGLILDPPTDEAWFDLAFMHKDIELALDTAKPLELALPAAESADRVLAQAISLGYERRDLAVLYQVLEQIAGGDRDAR
jgi:3-hydroxyisobutyrate dehydrogenase-like beta-hydroxyacid dehydrogenase